MRGSAVRPRPDQVADLTRAGRLPLAPVAQDQLDILGEGFRQAFDDIRKHAPATVATGDEPEVTSLMAAGLNVLIQEDSLGAARPLGRTGIRE